MRVVWSFGLLLGLALSGAPSTGGAQSDESARGAARQLGNEGIVLYEQGDYAAASERLERAYAVIEVATLGLWSARALAKTGKLVQASERYLAVTRMQLPSDAPEIMREAQLQAEREQADLAGRIPSLTVRLAAGESTAGIAIELDGVAFRPELVGLPIPIDPGPHAYRVSREGKTLTGSVTVAEAEKKELALTFADAAEPPSAPPSSPPKEQDAAVLTPGPRPPEGDAGEGRSGRGQRLAGITALGAGAAGLVVGGALGGAALGKKSDLESSGLCEGTRCATPMESDIDRYDTLRVGSTLGFVIGGVGVATGAVLLVTAPKGQGTARLEPWVGLGAAGLRGRF